MWPKQLIQDLKDLRNAVYSTSSDILPAKENCLRAFNMPPDRVRVVILGQDPYPTPGKAQGLSFVTPPDMKPTSSIKNIIDEVRRDTGLIVGPDLAGWAEQGVLLLNTRLTVSAGAPMSHAGLGWEKLIAETLKYLDQNHNFVVMAWGREAQKMTHKTIKRNLILETSHPCKYSAHRGFIGCSHFSRANWVLETFYGLRGIVWGRPT